MWLFLAFGGHLFLSMAHFCQSSLIVQQKKINKYMHAASFAGTDDCVLTRYSYSGFIWVDKAAQMTLLCRRSIKKVTCLHWFMFSDFCSVHSCKNTHTHTHAPWRSNRVLCTSQRQIRHLGACLSFRVIIYFTVCPVREPKCKTTIFQMKHTKKPACAKYANK